MLETHYWLQNPLILRIVPSGIVVLILFLGFGNAYACEVLSLPSAQEAFDSESTVFSGRVAKFEEFGKGDDKMRIAFFEVDRYWKNPNEKDYEELIVTTAIDHGACGYDFETDKSYLVYATAWSRGIDSLSTSIGTRTQLLENAQEDLAFLGEGNVPTRQVSWNDQLAAIEIQPITTGEEEQAEGTILSVVGIGVAIAGVAAFLAMRYRR